MHTVNRTYLREISRVPVGRRIETFVVLLLPVVSALLARCDHLRMRIEVSGRICETLRGPACQIAATAIALPRGVDSQPLTCTTSVWSLHRDERGHSHQPSEYPGVQNVDASASMHLQHS